MRRLLAILVAGSTILGGTILPSAAITFGNEVSSASSQYPSVVSIWYSENASEDPGFICTGTLIQRRVVLTAAHCIFPTGLVYIKYGADQLDEELPLYSVSAVWRNPRYSASQSVNDVGLLLLEKEIPGATVFPLSSASKISSIQKNKSVQYRIIGWGIDQNEELPTYLRTSIVTDQSAVVKKFVKSWRNDVWFAVGKFIKSEGVYSGICSGDSGGPLFATLNGETVIAGVASFTFAEECEVRAPSVFSRLSYYISDINKGILQLPLNEAKQNRGLPSVVSEPKIIGSARTGSTITCDKGVWSSNTSNVTLTWSGSGVPFGFTGTSLSVTANTSYSVKQFICTVRGSNSNGTVTRELSLNQNPPPTNTSRPLVLNMPTVASSSNVTLTCTPGTFNYSTSVSN